ncbi:MAG: esterase-like activity of phytase family protein [Gemmatimonadales bacterium]
MPRLAQLGAFCLVVLAGPLGGQRRPTASAHPLLGARILATIDRVPVRNGGFGSGLSRDPGTGDWLLLTDRGPNFDVADDVKAFPLPDFVPMVGRFRMIGAGSRRRLELIDRITLHAKDGSPISGLPSVTGPGATGERAVTIDGRDLPPATNGLDPEGIHALRDGTFWIADEYGPSLVHFDRSGREIERASPLGEQPKLPAVLARRRPNRGFEGLTGDADGTRLIAVVQSPLDNPKTAGRQSRSARIVVYHPATGDVEQYLYRLDRPEHFVGDLTMLPDRTLLVIENDGTPPSPTSHRRIVRVDLSAATRLGPEVTDGATIESLDSTGLATRGIAPAAKTLVVDLATLGYRHDKPEGIALVGPTEIAVINDDDFGITAGPGGRPVAKRLLGRRGPTDQNVLWIVRVATPLWSAPPPP